MENKVVFVACIDDNDYGASTYVFMDKQDAIMWLWNDMYVKLSEYDFDNEDDDDDDDDDKDEILKEFGIAYIKDNMRDARYLVDNLYDGYNCWVSEEKIWQNSLLTDNKDYFDKLDEIKVLK